MNETRRNYMMNDEIFMKEAIRLSQLAVSHGNEPFGAVLVKDGEIIFSNENQIYTGSDPTFHAEAGLLRRFCAETVSYTHLDVYKRQTKYPQPKLRDIGCHMILFYKPQYIRDGHGNGRYIGHQ